MAKNILTRLFLLAEIFIFLTSPLKSQAAIGPLRPFGGRILNIAPNLDPLCPAGTNILTAGLPAPIVAIFTNVPGLVVNPPASQGAWVLGLALPPIPPCLPIVFLMGVSRSLSLGFGF